MFHTIQIQKLLSREEMQLLVDSCTISIKNIEEDKARFFEENTEDPADIPLRFLQQPSRATMRKVNKGLLQLRLGKFFNMTHRRIVYYVSILLDLEATVINDDTNKLYVASDHNNFQLEEAFAAIIYEIFPVTARFKPYIDEYTSSQVSYGVTMRPLPHAVRMCRPIEVMVDDDGDEDTYLAYEQGEECTLGSLPYLFLWSVKRLDISANLYVDNVNLYLDLAKKSFLSYYGMRLSKTDYGNSNVSAASGSGGFIIYNKAEKIKDKCNAGTIGKKLREKLLSEPLIENVARVELQIMPNRQWIRSSKSDLNAIILRPRESVLGPAHLLHEELSKLLDEEYERFIGLGSWYKAAEYNRLVDAAREAGRISTNYCNQFKNGLAPLVTLAHTVEFAKTRYLSNATMLPTWKNGEEAYGGSKAETFNKLVRNCRSIGLQPVLLNSAAKIDCVINPYYPDNFILCGDPKENNSIIFVGGSISTSTKFYAATRVINDLAIHQSKSRSFSLDDIKRLLQDRTDYLEAYDYSAAKEYGIDIEFDVDGEAHIYFDGVEQLD